MGRIKGNNEDVAFVTNGKDWIKVDAGRRRPGPNVGPGAIQNQAIWNGELKRGTRKPALADDADLDVLTKVNRLNFLDQSEIGFDCSFRNSRVLRGHVQCELARYSLCPLALCPSRRKNDRIPDGDDNDLPNETVVL